jgi:hypothetical protein
MCPALRIIRGHGRIVSDASARIVCVWGLIVAMSTIPAIGKVAPRIRHDYFADKIRCFGKG